MKILETQWIQLSYDEETCLFDVYNKQLGQEIITHAFSSITVISPNGEEISLPAYKATGKELELNSNSTDTGNVMTLTAIYSFNSDFIFSFSITIQESQPHILFQNSLEQMPDDYRIKAFYPLMISKDLGGTLILGQLKNWRLFRQDWQSWSPVEIITLDTQVKRPWMKIPKRILFSTSEKLNKGEFLSDNFLVVKNIETQQFITLGFISMRDHLTHVDLQVNYTNNEISKLFARSLLGNVVFKKEEKIYSEKLVLLINGMTALESLSYYANLSKNEMDAIFWSHIPTGWCSWYFYYSRVSEDLMLQNLKFLASHKELPFEFVQLDDGYQRKRGANRRIGDWIETNDRFPHGLEWLSQQILAEGFNAGLWIAPFLVSKVSDLYREHPDWVIHEKDGSPMEAEINPEWGLFNKFYALDCTHPEVQKWLHDLFTAITKKWGYKFVKIDFIFAAAIDGVFHDSTKTRVQAYRKGLEIIRDAVGTDTFILGCGAPLGPSIGLVNGMRIGPDTYYGFNQPFLYWFLNKFFFAGLGNMPSMKEALKIVVLRSFMHNYLWLNDPDCLLVRQKRSSLKLHEIQFEVTLLGLCGGLVLSSDNLSELTPEDHEFIKFLLPASRKSAIPIDLFEADPPMYLKLEIAKSSLFDPYYLIGIFNWTKKSQEICISAEQFQLPKNSALHVFDFWEKRYFQLQRDEEQFHNLQKDSAKLLVIRPIRDTPQLIASTFHITQGATEITNLEFDLQNRNLTIELEKPGLNQGKIFLYLPDAYKEKNVTTSALSSESYRSQDGLLVIQVQFEDKTKIRVTFEKKTKKIEN